MSDFLIPADLRWAPGATLPESDPYDTWDPLTVPLVPYAPELPRARSITLQDVDEWREEQRAREWDRRADALSWAVLFGVALLSLAWVAKHAGVW